MVNMESAKIENIKPYKKNAKKHPKKQIQQIANSIKEFGFNQPLVLDKNNEIIVGHGRLEGAKLLGMEEVPVIYKENLTEKQVKAYRLADNKLNESDWEMELVIEELKGLENEGLVELTGFDKDLLLEVDEKDDIVPEVPEDPKSKLGDIYQLGEHRLMCGDSTKVEDMANLMDGKKANMVFTDPPYNVDYKGAAGKIKNDKFNSNKEFYQFLYDSIFAMKQHVVGDVYIAMSSSEIHTLQKAFIDCGGHWSTFIIWIKDKFTLGRSNYQRQYEPILYGWFEGSSHYWSGKRNLGDIVEENMREDLDGSVWLKVQDDEIGTNIWREKKPDHNKEHPTMKPVNLLLRGIVNSSLPKNIVLDPFLGSGSTLIACEKSNRICYGMELDPKYVDVIIKRWEDYTGKKAVKITEK